MPVLHINNQVVLLLLIPLHGIGDVLGVVFPANPMAGETSADGARNVMANLGYFTLREGFAENQDGVFQLLSTISQVVLDVIAYADFRLTSRGQQLH